MKPGNVVRSLFDTTMIISLRLSRTWATWRVRPLSWTCRSSFWRMDWLVCYYSKFLWIQILIYCAPQRYSWPRSSYQCYTLRSPKRTMLAKSATNKWRKCVRQSWTNRAWRVSWWSCSPSSWIRDSLINFELNYDFNLDVDVLNCWS